MGITFPRAHNLAHGEETVQLLVEAGNAIAKYEDCPLFVSAEALVLEVAENNEHALQWYRKRGFRKLDAAIFMSLGVDNEPELLPPRVIEPPPPPAAGDEQAVTEPEEAS